MVGWVEPHGSLWRPSYLLLGDCGRPADSTTYDSVLHRSRSFERHACCSLTDSILHAVNIDAMMVPNAKKQGQDGVLLDSTGKMLAFLASYGNSGVIPTLMVLHACHYHLHVQRRSEQ